MAVSSKPWCGADTARDMVWSISAKNCGNRASAARHWISAWPTTTGMRCWKKSTRKNMAMDGPHQPRIMPPGCAFLAIGGLNKTEYKPFCGGCGGAMISQQSKIQKIPWLMPHCAKCLNGYGRGWHDFLSLAFIKKNGPLCS